MTVSTRHLTLAVVAAAACAAAQPAVAATVIDISGATNITTASYTNGAYYPSAGSTVSVKGVDFKLAGASGYAGLVQTTFANRPASVSFAVAPVSASTFYTLINTTYGTSTGVEAGQIVFNFNDKTSYAYSLVSGVNTRDHYGSGGISNALGTVNYGGNVHFDAQKIDLPTEYLGKVLGSITLIDTVPAGTSNSVGGSPFLAALSFDPAVAAAVPEPATWAMMILGFGVAGGAIRRKRSAAAVRLA